MFGTKAASRQDMAIQAVVLLVLVAILEETWRVLDAQSLMNQVLRMKIPDKPSIVMESNAAMEQVAASWQATMVCFFCALGFATSQNARAVGMWPQTAAGSFRVAAWSAMAFASVATAGAALARLAFPVEAYPGITSLGAVPACLTATLALQCVSIWLASHAIGRGFEAGRGRASVYELWACAAIVGLVMLVVGLCSYAFLTFPINVYLPRPVRMAQSDLSVVPFHWITGRIGLPEGACLAVPIAVGVLTVLAGAWLVVREPLRPGMIDAFLTRRGKA